MMTFKICKLASKPKKVLTTAGYQRGGDADSQIAKKQNLSCCILAHNNIDLTLRLLRSIASQDSFEPHEVIFKLIVDSNQKENLQRSPEFKTLSQRLQLDILTSPSNDVCVKRNLLLKTCTSNSLLMLDGDTELTRKEYLREVCNILNSTTSCHVFAGPYINSSYCSLWGLSYNFIANCWLAKSPKFPDLTHFLGGVFLMSHLSDEQLADLTFEEHQFGGEEIKFAKTLRSKGIPIKWSEAMGVFHHCNHSLSTFISRAIAHGSADNKSETSFKLDFKVFFRTPAPVFVKTIALFYVSLARAVQLLAIIRGKIAL